MRPVGLGPLAVICRSLPARTRLNLSLAPRLARAILLFIMDSLEDECEEVRIQLWTHERGEDEVTTFKDLFLLARLDSECSLREALDQDLPPGSKLYIGNAPMGTSLQEVEAKAFKPQKAGRVSISQLVLAIQRFFITQLPNLFVTVKNIVILIGDVPHAAHDDGEGAIVPYQGTPAAGSTATAVEPNVQHRKKGRGPH